MGTSMTIGRWTAAGRRLLGAGTLLAAVLLGGCGYNDFQSRRRAGQGERGLKW